MKDLQRPWVGDREFWAKRAGNYSRLEWANRHEYLDFFVECGHFTDTHRILDVGTGTGIIARTLAPFAEWIVGIDTSPHMLSGAAGNHPPNVVLSVGDVRRLSFRSEVFDRVTARMVFHHVLEDAADGIAECRRVLRPGGRLILSEGIPPHPDLEDWYTRMFALKEERITFLERDLVGLMEAGGFPDPVVFTHVSRGVSIRNWLANSGLPPDRQEQIYRMHIDLDAEQRRHYNAAEFDGDMFLDMTFLALVGHKTS